MDTKIIAEIGINHNGDLGIAKKLIEEAASAGADFVKFQKRNPDICVPEHQKNILRDTPWGKLKYIDYKKKIGFAGPFYIEPKPCEPSTHQYDRDVATCLNFLRTYDLTEHFRLNIETNHAELAGHTMEHELRMAAQAGMLGSIDANRGDPLLGWDTDQFPNSVAETAKVMLVVLGMGGFTTGGLNFDAKRRRESHEPEDLFHAFIGGMDTYAHGLKVAAAIRADGSLAEAVQARYSSFDSEAGLKIERGEMSLEELEAMALEAGEPVLASARQEMLENLFNRYL